jgi:hypothetical protein
MYKNIILSVVLNGCETWSLTPRRKLLIVFESRILRKIFRPQEGEVTGGLRKLLDEEFDKLFSLPNNIKIIK